MCRIVKVVVAPDITVMLVQQGDNKPPRVFGTDVKLVGTFRQSDFREIPYVDMCKFDHSEVSHSITNLTVVPRQGVYNNTLMLTANESANTRFYLGMRVYCLGTGAFELLVRPKTYMDELVQKQLLPKGNSSLSWTQLYFCRAESEVLLLFDVLKSVNSDSELIGVKVMSRTFGSIIVNMTKIRLPTSYSKKMVNSTTGQVSVPLTVLDQILPPIPDEVKKRLKTPTLSGTKGQNSGARVLLYLTFVAMLTGCIIRIRYYFLKQEARRLSRMRISYLRNNRDRDNAPQTDDSNVELGPNTSKIDNQKYEALVTKRVLGEDLGPWNEAR